MTPELPPIEYIRVNVDRPTFRLDSSGLVVGTATQEEWDAAVEAMNDKPAACAALESVE